MSVTTIIYPNKIISPFDTISHKETNHNQFKIKYPKQYTIYTYIWQIIKSLAQ